jgi:hypothetical protein
VSTTPTRHRSASTLPIRQTITPQTHHNQISSSRCGTSTQPQQGWQNCNSIMLIWQWMEVPCQFPPPPLMSQALNKDSYMYVVLIANHGAS